MYSYVLSFFGHRGTKLAADLNATLYVLRPHQTDREQPGPEYIEETHKELGEHAGRLYDI